MNNKSIRRMDGRRANELRPVKITTGFVRTADGSCLIEMGGTRIICTATVENGLPKWRENSGLGWVTAEYGMLPASTGQRKRRPGVKNDGRNVEIQRLIGRVMRSVVRFEKLTDTTIYIDCDVIEADGGTRTASITGAYVALALAVKRGEKDGRFSRGVLSGAIAAVSVGVVGGREMLDLCYIEDATADVDMNIAMTNSGKYVELQGTSEAQPFSGEQLEKLLLLGRRGIKQLLREQTKALNTKE